MIYLLIVSLIWSFSFGLIKGNLTNIDSSLVSFIRLFLSFVVFIPFIKLNSLENKLKLKLIITGAIQYGLMYISYIYSYQFLMAHEVALFTIFTPIYVTIINDLLEKKFHKVFLISSILAVLGTAVIKFENISNTDFIVGFLVVQISNISFAFGQIYYVKLKKEIPAIKDLNIFGYLYFGAVILSGLATAVTSDFTTLQSISQTQILTLLYLGVLASGICFFLWNLGATKTDTGTLAVLNNIKIPLAIIVSLLFFNEESDVVRLIIGGGIVFGALFLNQKLLKSKS